MQILLYLTDFIVPLVIFGIVGYGLLMKVPVYDTFIKGAKKGFLTVIKIMPTLVGLMVAVGLDIFKEYGTDSYIGRIASISMSCTETIFYTMSVYYMTARVTKTRYTLTGALLATLAGVTASVVLAGMMT